MTTKTAQAIIADELCCGSADERAAAAGRVIAALKAAGITLVQSVANPTPPRLKAPDLRLGMLCRMRKGGIRRIVRIVDRHPSDLRDRNVFWLRVDDGPMKGKTGKQWAPYFAADIAEVLEAAQ